MVRGGAASKHPTLWNTNEGISQPPLRGCLSRKEIPPLMIWRVLGLEDSDAAVVKHQFSHPPGEELVALYTSDHSFFGATFPLNLHLSHQFGTFS